MQEAVISITPPHSWIKHITSSFPDVVIRVLDCRNIPETRGVQELFEIRCDAEVSNRVIELLKEDDYVYDVDIIKGKPGRIVGSLKTKKCTACRSFATANCFIVSASSKPNGKLEWTLLGSDTMVKMLLKRLEEAEIVATVLRVSQLREEKEITTRQEYLLQIAFEKGYYEFPKKITLRQLAKILEISPAALTEILRRGQKHVLQEHFHGRPSVLTRQDRLLGF